MGTPIKHLFNPKILSPLSPTILAKQKAAQIYGSSPNKKILTSARNVSRTLTFPVSPNSFVANNCLVSNKTQKIQNRCNIKIKVTDYSEESLVINTPNKTSLLKYGLNSTKNLNILGKGSFGTVVRGIYKGIDVAVKIVKLNGNNLSSLRERNALHLSHENVTKIIDIIHSHKTNYGIILMEYLKFSRHLQNVLDVEKMKLNEKIIVEYGLDVCKGLHYCHKNGILHLDIKPSNILVCENGLCKLCDFGNCMKLEENSDWNPQQCTVAYAAPEILLGKPPTTKCDVYSLGILLWQMKYREIPYRELDGIEVTIYKVVKFGYRPNVPLTSVPDEYSSIYSSCWAGNPLDRPDLSSVIDTLKNILDVV